MSKTQFSANETVSVTCLTLKISLPGIRSLKEKRSNILPILTKVRKEFNCSIAEVGLQDIWQSGILGIVVISNNADHNTRVMHQVLSFIESHFPSIQVEEFNIFSLW